MNYWRARLRIYHQLLKQWLDSIRQMSIAIVALFPLALSALLLLPLLAWGMIGDANTNNETWVYTLWGYLLFVYSWMVLQREGISGSNYKYYLDSLGVSRAKQSWCTLGISLYGANVFVLGPLFIFLMVFKHATELISIMPMGDIIEQVAPAAGLMFLSSYYAISAVHMKRLPWASLLVLPFVLLFCHDSVSKIQCLVLWCVAILIERNVKLPQMVLGAGFSGLFRLFLQDDLAAPRRDGLRYVSLLLLFIVMRIMFLGVPAESKSSVAHFTGFCTAVVMASSLFHSKSLVQKYPYYLSSLPCSTFKFFGYAISYGLIKTIPWLVLMGALGWFSAEHWLLWGVFYITTLMGIIVAPTYFFAFPVAGAAVAFMCLYV